MFTRTAVAAATVAAALGGGVATAQAATPTAHTTAHATTSVHPNSTWVYKGRYNGYEDCRAAGATIVIFGGSAYSCNPTSTMKQYDLWVLYN